jgi:hypothetical protein
MVILMTTVLLATKGHASNYTVYIYIYIYGETHYGLSTCSKVHDRVLTHTCTLLLHTYRSICSYTLTDCAVCADGYTSSSGYQCTKCKGTVDNVTIAVIVIVVALLLIVCWYIISDLLTLETTQHETNALNKALQSIVQRAKQLPWNKLRIPIVVMQLPTQFISITGTQYPPIYGDYLKWLDIINLDMS